MAMVSQSPAVKRLLQDLKQLKEEPIVGINAEPFGDDLMTWYGIVLGIEGSPYAGIPIRFSLEFSSNYPKEPPNAYFDTQVPYYGGGSYRDNTGRLVVCLNIFGNFSKIHTEWANLSEGWTPAYTVQTILVSMQALMLSDMLSKEKQDIKLMAESAKNFNCPITGHIGSDPTKWFPQVIRDQEVAESIAAASGRIGFDNLRDFYVCYVNKSTAKDGARLGYGINVENPRIGTLSSPCEYLSLAAYNNGTRHSSTNKQFEYWIPILIHSNEWKLIKPRFLDSINLISQKINVNGNSNTKIFKICSSIMNTLVVEIMNNKNNATANDKFINGYLAFYRLLVEYAKKDPSTVTMADKQLKDFIQIPSKRNKRSVQNLGELLIYLLISKNYNWADLGLTFIAECDARNFFWYAIGNNQNAPKCPELSSTSIVKGRSAKVFDATQVSRNLVMFQVRFSKVAKNLKPEMMDLNNGLAPDNLRYELKDLYNLISTVNSWNDYFTWLEMPNVSDQTRDLQLLEALRLSERQGYHNPGQRPNYSRC